MSEEVLAAALVAQLTAERDAWRGRAERAEAEAAGLREALEWRHTCENCGGKGVYWVDVDGEAEAEVCDCWARADHVLNHDAPGAALLAVVDATRTWIAAIDGLSGVWAAEGEARRVLQAYDEAVKE